MNLPPLLAMERLALLQFNATSPFLTLLIKSDNFQPSSQRIIEQLEAHFENDSVLIGHSQLNEIFILLSRMNESSFSKKVEKLLSIFQKDSSVKIGIGYSVNSLEEIQYSYIQQKMHYNLESSDQRLHYYEDVELLALLKKSPANETQRFTSRVLNGLNDQLRQTLNVYFESNQNTTESAEVLEIHRHTLTYRLRKINEITGYDPTVLQDAIVLKIALLLHE